MTPNPITVPQSQRPAIQELAKLSDDAYGALRACIIDGRLHAEPAALIEQASKATEIHTKLGGQIISALIGIRSLIDSANMSLADVAGGVVADAQSKTYVPAESIEDLSSRLRELLDAPTIVVASKAYALVVADAAPFSDVRIVSDVRPIFTGKDERLEFSGSVIVHHLHVEVSVGDDQHSALTTPDLLKLKRVVERALEKDRKLRDLLRSGPLSPLEPSPESK